LREAFEFGGLTDLEHLGCGYRLHDRALVTAVAVVATLLEAPAVEEVVVTISVVVIEGRSRGTSHFLLRASLIGVDTASG
jgi:hypothetical protein